jgi:hypothetical protein
MAHKSKGIYPLALTDFVCQQCLEECQQTKIATLEGKGVAPVAILLPLAFISL